MAMGTEQQVLLQHFGEQLVKQPKEKEKEKKGISAVFLIVKKKVWKFVMVCIRDED